MEDILRQLMHSNGGDIGGTGARDKDQEHARVLPPVRALAMPAVAARPGAQEITEGHPHDYGINRDGDENGNAIDGDMQSLTLDGDVVNHTGHSTRNAAMGSIEGYTMETALDTLGSDTLDSIHCAVNEALNDFMNDTAMDAPLAHRPAAPGGNTGRPAAPAAAAQPAATSAPSLPAPAATDSVHCNAEIHHHTRPRGP